MSADNYVVVRKFPEGWRWGMGFASADIDGTWSLSDDQFGDQVFATADQAYEDAETECPIIEYGISIEEEKPEAVR